MANAIITRDELRGLGEDLTELLEAYGLSREERIAALLSGAYGEAAAAGLTVGQLKDRFSRVLVECHQMGLKLADQSPPSPAHRAGRNGS